MQITRTAPEIEAEIARLRRQMREWDLEGRLDCEQEDLLLGEISDLQDDLYAAEWDQAVAALSDAEQTRIDPTEYERAA